MSYTLRNYVCMSLRKRFRRPRIVMAALTLSGSAWALSACSAPPTLSQVTSTSGVYDQHGNMIVRLGVNEFIGYDPANGYVTRNDGTGWYGRVGWNNLVPFSYTYAIPTSANGPIGPLVRWGFSIFQFDNRYSTAHYDMRIGVDYGNVHIGVSVGTCDLFTHYVITATGSVSFNSVSDSCSTLATSAATREGVVPTGVTGPYLSLTPAQKAHVDQLLVQLRQLAAQTTLKGTP